MAALLSLVAALPKLKRLTAEEAARRLGVTMAELEEANRFALVTFADADPEFRRSVRRPSNAPRSASECR